MDAAGGAEGVDAADAEAVWGTGETGETGEMEAEGVEGGVDSSVGAGSFLIPCSLFKWVFRLEE